MSELFSEEIIGKNAITSGGYPIGSVEDIVIDTETGELKYLLVRPAAGNISTQKTDGKGRAVINIGSIKVSGDNVIIS
jgi:sporulation protein YlmC with PRC-barrel domain